MIRVDFGFFTLARLTTSEAYRIDYCDKRNKQTGTVEIVFKPQKYFWGIR